MESGEEELTNTGDRSPNIRTSESSTDESKCEKSNDRIPHVPHVPHVHKSVNSTVSTTKSNKFVNSSENIALSAVSTADFEKSVNSAESSADENITVPEEDLDEPFNDSILEQVSSTRPSIEDEGDIIEDKNDVL